jgi:hypothetical protein
MSSWLELLDKDAMGSAPSRLPLRLFSSFVAMDLSASEAGEAGCARSTVGGVSGRALVVPEVFERGGSGGGMGRAGG